MRSVLICRLGAIAGRMVCILAVALLACASSAHSQVIEEGGFPVKGGGVSGEPFSLSCPPRLYVEAGESVLFSCSATAVPEEGVRYGWESLSGDGLHLLSDANERSPLFTAPVSEAGGEYVYRLTAMSVGVYETATVTVMARGVSGGSVQDRGKSPGSLEGCDSFGALEGEYGEGCVAGDKMPPSFEPFEGGLEDEGGPGLLFPEAPGLPDRPAGPVRGGGLGRQTLPRLECPVAVFLEELETGLVECHAWDASGEEFLEYSWEPVGSTTRDYLDNPRLIPEDSPTPSVVAPEAPAYETLESFHSGETTFRYRYRLTVMSRATGLSSSSEVEVYVSSSRPSVYCPLEVVVEEGETVALDCEGIDPLSARMDYDEEAASILWEWESLWGTSMAPLAATDLSSALFTAPPGSAGEEYHYIVSMTSSASGAPRTARRRVTVRVTGGEGMQAADASALMFKGSAPAVTCNDSEVYEAAADFTLDCSVTDEPTGATYSWTGTDVAIARLSSTTILKPTFDVLDDVPPGTFLYEYTVTMSAGGVDVASDDVTVAIRNKPDITVTCEDSPYDVDEGDADFDFACSASGAPGTDPDYTWSWSPTTNLTDHDTDSPRFAVPDDVDQDTTWTYTVTASAANADDGTAEVKVIVRNAYTTAIHCPGNPYSVDEGSDRYELDCRVENLPTNVSIGYEFSGALDLLDIIAARLPILHFTAPTSVDADTTYEYTFTISVGATKDLLRTIASRDFSVTVLDTDSSDPSLTCTDSEVYEGTADFALDCSVTDEPTGATYAWTARGSTSDTNDLSSTTILKPTFSVPDDIDEPDGADKDYEYKVTMLASGINGSIVISHFVTITVREKPDIKGCNDDVNLSMSVDEGSGAVPLLICMTRTGAPEGSVYTSTWSTRDGTPSSALSLLNTENPQPLFLVPADVPRDTTYKYLLTVSADNADDLTERYNVTVRDTDTADPSLTCTDSEVYEGAADFTLDCSVANEPSGATYAWTARGSTANTNDLSSTTILKPTFSVPDDIDESGGADKDYEYTVTMSASGIDDITADVTVTVLEKPNIYCSQYGEGNLAVSILVYEGHTDKSLNILCDSGFTGAPGTNPVYTYAWTARGSTPDTGRLSATNIEVPTFSVPNTIEFPEWHYYRLTVSAANADDALVPVSVEVRNAVSVVCKGPYEVDEGDAGIELECDASGGSPGSTYTWSWIPSTNLTDHNTGTPMFAVPDDIDKDTTYTYTVTSQTTNINNALHGTAEVTVTVKDTDTTDPSLTCTDSEVYEGASDITLDCSVTNEPSGATYAWTARGSTSDTDDLSSTTVLKPTFAVPGDIDELNGADKAYEYTVTLSASGIDDVTEEVTVTVLEKPDIYCSGTAENGWGVVVGSSDFPLLICEEGWEGAPGASPVYAYAWTAGGITPDTRRLSATNIEAPLFDVPDEVVETGEVYTYTLTVSAANADDATGQANVVVIYRDLTDPVITCTDPDPVYEGATDFPLDCSVTDEPTGATYAWTARGSTSDTDDLSSTTILKPTFDVPDNVDADTDYDYTVTLSASGIDDVTEDVTVRVLNKPSLTLVCAPPAPVYEGVADFDLDCVASGDPSGSDNYNYVWTPRGSTVVPGQLSSTTIAKPTFDVPDNVDADTDYEYTLTVSADNAESATEDVTVTVLNKKALEVACATPSPVYEGSEDLALDCVATGAPAGSEYAYVWTARGGTTNTDRLIANVDGPTPTFDVPEEVDSDETYEYLLTVSAENAEEGAAEVTVTVLNLGSIALICASPPLVYEGSEDLDFDCSISGDTGAANYTYEWTARGATQNTDELSATNISSPTFYVPDEVDETTTYEYLLTARAANVEDATAEVTVTVLNRGALAVACAPPPLVYEGSADFDLDCTVAGAPSGSDYEYVWTARGGTTSTDRLIAGTDGPTPTFSVPDEVDETTTYEYLLTVSAENAEDGSAAVTVTVLNQGALRVVCVDPPSVYEGSEDFDLDCSASGAPSGSDYAYVWTARGTTANTALLIAGTDSPTPTFSVPDELDATTTYEYLLTASAENAESGSAEVTVTVLNAGALHVVCADTPSIYEGSEDFALDCTASGAPAGSEYTYAWTARGSTANTDLLSRADIPSPTFHVPDEVDETTTYEYLLRASAENAEDGSAEVTVTVLNAGALRVVCADPLSIYEGSEDFALDCTASEAPSGSAYEYAWTARESTANTDQLSATDISSPTFYVPDEVDETTTYEYLLTVSAENAEDGAAEVTVTVLNRGGALSVVCMHPGSVYEDSEDITLDCTASSAPAGSAYVYVWTAQGDTENTLQLSATDIPSPTFYVPDAVDETTDYEYLLTVSTENAADALAEVVVTVLNKETLAVVCMDPGSVYEGSEDFAFNCTASGAPPGPEYTYVWTARDSTANTDLLSRPDISSPTFHVPDDVDSTTTYKYLLTASADNAEDASAEVMVTVLDGAPLVLDDAIAGRVYIFTVGEIIEDVLLPEATGGLSPYTYTLEPVLPRGLRLKVDDDTTRTISGTPLEVSPRSEYTWQVTDANAETAQIAFFIEVAPAVDTTSVPVAESSSELPEPSALGVTVSASPLRFGVQSADTEVSLDPMTDLISTYVSGPYHAGRMTLALDSGEALDENGEMDLSIELASPVVLRRERGIKATSIILAPQWSLAESCEQLSSQAIGGLYTEVTLSESDCHLLRFGGELDLTDALSGQYKGSLDIILRSGETEETHSVEVSVTVVPARRVITIGPGGVRFGTSREVPASLTEEQNLSIYPDVAFLAEAQPDGVFELSNPSLIPLEISVSARFGYTEATGTGREVVIEDTLDSRLGDLSEVVDIHPGVLVLQPGEKGLVRYGVKEGALAAIAEKGYAAFFDVVSEPRLYVRTDQMPKEVTDRTARVTMRVPGVYVPGEGASQLRATLLSVSFVGSMSATFLLETADHPFAGEVVAYDGDGRELGRTETLVYTRSRVRIPLDRMPEEGAVFLRFAPRGSGHVPEPAFIEWDAPRRDIGAAENEGRTSLPATLVQKP